MTSSETFVPKTAATEPCKCCGETATPLGAVDFNRSCEDHRRPPLAPARIPIEYHRCPACGFVFSIAFDDFTPDDFRRHIYNDGYAAVDPDFEEARPRHNALWISDELFPDRKTLRLLDYGGGGGKLVDLLHTAGFARAVTFDPFYSGERPTGRFDVVSCFEVLEHTPTPFDTMRDVRSFLADPGLVIFSTLMQPVDFDQLGLSWWYAAPRNGHVSLYSREAMTALLKRLNLKWGSFSDVAHVAFRGRMPAFARHLVKA